MMRILNSLRILNAPIFLGVVTCFITGLIPVESRAEEEIGKRQSKSQLTQTATEVPIERKTAKAKELSDAFRAAAEKGLPSVVTVFARRVDKDEEEKVDLLELLGEDPTENHNVGSGVILTADGLIVTNHHVVDKCTRVRIRLPDGREYLGTDIKSDKSSDLAILKIETPKKLSHITLADSNTTSVGDWVLAIGSPFAIEQTVSAGIISGKSRDVRGLVAGQLLQTDAAINPGNSGGALLNLDGELIGINSAIASTSGVFEGVGFAIPVSRVKWIISELRENGKVRRATMGVRVAPLPAEIAEQLDLPIRSGAFVVGLRDGYPAESAGLKKGDVILKLADQTVQSPQDLNAIVEQLPIEQPQSLTILREGKRVDMTITLQAKRE